MIIDMHYALAINIYASEQCVYFNFLLMIQQSKTVK
jgi:hypothetical protein